MTPSSFRPGRPFAELPLTLEEIVAAVRSAATPEERPDDLAAIAEIASVVRSHRPPVQHSIERWTMSSGRRISTRLAAAIVVTVLTAGSSLALTGELPRAATEAASGFLARIGLPAAPSVRIVSYERSTPPHTTGQTYEPVDDGSLAMPAYDVIGGPDVPSDPSSTGDGGEGGGTTTPPTEQTSPGDHSGEASNGSQGGSGNGIGSDGPANEPGPPSDPPGNGNPPTDPGPHDDAGTPGSSDTDGPPTDDNPPADPPGVGPPSDPGPPVDTPGDGEPPADPGPPSDTPGDGEPPADPGPPSDPPGDAAPPEEPGSVGADPLEQANQLDGTGLYGKGAEHRGTGTILRLRAQTDPTE